MRQKSKKNHNFVAGRSEEKSDYLYGRNPVLEALQSGAEINKAWVLKSPANAKRDHRLSKIVRALRDRRIVIQYVDKLVLDRLADNREHQGVVVQIAAFSYVDFDEQLAHLAERDALVIVLDEIQEGYNLGSILRIAEAAGVDLIVIPKHRSASLDSHVAKASAGAIMHVPVARVVNLSSAVEQLKEVGFWSFGAALDERSEDYRTVDYRGKCAILIGNEGKGLSQKIKEHCDHLVKIPMHGVINSLNAAVATGIIVYEASTQRNPLD